MLLTILDFVVSERNLSPRIVGVQEVLAGLRTFRGTTSVGNRGLSRLISK